MYKDDGDGEGRRLADPVDRASHWEEQERRVARVLSRRPVLANVGVCYSCLAGVPGLFCDVFCREDFEKVQAAERRAGRR